jgi:hypothetical protein
MTALDMREVNGQPPILTILKIIYNNNEVALHCNITSVPVGV